MHRMGIHITKELNNITEYQYKHGDTPPYVPAGYQAPSDAAKPAVSPYQGVAIRFVALLIDVVILAIITAVITVPFQMPVVSITDVTNVQPTVTTMPNPFAWIGGLVSILVIFGYFVLLEGAYGQTVGKMAVKIKVTREDGSKIDYADAVVRNVLRIIDGILAYLIGAILIWSSDEKQRLGDRVAHTVVVKA